ncbi:hypothetical protein ALC57_01251 [Trachymyrmex cornetzi]|uniref:Uncharacterized protein n=1 Tax=Trachymyrmex cornetzi TaxID=471704 RepID=A0A151JQH6_9HYME|nr:hypothetical protein ALC57_01251 [Trachymyrmex cornetzi]
MKLEDIQILKFLLYATKQKLQSEGSSDFAIIINYLIKNTSKAGHIRAFCEEKIQTSLFSKEKCLAMLLSLNLSKFQYIHLRENSIENGIHQCQSYYQVKHAKLEYYPPKDKITITTTIRLLSLYEDKLHLYTNLKLICKRGFDGISNQSTNKNFEITHNATAVFL